jgi:hypothetical protein
MSDAEIKEKVYAESDRPAAPTEPTPEEVEKSKQSFESRERLRRAKESFMAASESRKRYDWEWLSRDLFRRGYQFSRYNPTSKTVILANRQNTKIPVNLTTAAMRVIRNQVTAFRPKWEVLPKPGSGEQGQKDARFGGKLLDAVWKQERLKKKTKETVTQGLLYSVGGAWQLGWDKDFKNPDGTTGKVTIWLIDPFDFYMDPNTTDGLAFTDAEFVIKAVRTSRAEVRKNPMYKGKAIDVPAESRVAASEYKQFLLQSLKNMGQYQVEDNETVILKEGYFKERDDKGTVSIRVIHWVDTSVEPLYEELLDEDDYPFRMYQADINPLEVYGESWAKHVIPINRVINALESSIFDYNYKFAKGRLVIDKNSGVRSVTNEHGSIIEKNRGAVVTTLPLQPIPASVEMQAQRFRMYFEDISGAHDASLGRIPTGVKSGIGISELKQADATNQDDLVDNLEDFLVEVGQKVLNILAKNLNTPRIFEIPGQNGEYERFAVIGEDFAKGRKNKTTVKVGEQEYPLAKLSKTNKVDVQIGSWLAYSKQARQEELKNLYEMGVIDQKTLLEHLEFGDVDSIMDRTRSEAMLKANRETPGASSPQVPEEQLALEENKMLLEGRMDVHAQPQDNHNVHLVVHQEAIGQGQDEAIRAHMQEHTVLTGQSGQQPQPPQPEVPSAGAPPLGAEQGGAPLPPPPPVF